MKASVQLKAKSKHRSGVESTSLQPFFIHFKPVSQSRTYAVNINKVLTQDLQSLHNRPWVKSTEVLDLFSCIISDGPGGE